MRTLTQFQYPRSTGSRMADGNGQRGTSGIIRFVPLTLVLALGIIIAALPHALLWPRLHAPIWLAGNDEIIYLSVAGRSYYDHLFSLCDPISSSTHPTIYPRLLFVPAIVAAKVMRLGPLGISFAWRIWAGLTVAAGWLAVTNRLLTTASFADARRKQWLAAGVTTVLLCDAGVMRYAPTVRQFAVAAAMVTGRGNRLLDICYPRMLEQWKIISPAVYLGYLLLHVWLVARARDQQSPIRVTLSAASFALLFVYFYLWTAALVALLLASVVDRNHAKVYLTTLGLGVLFGLPAIVEAMHFRQVAVPDWFARNNFFAAGEPRAPLHWGNLLLYGATFFWLRRVGRQFTYLWTIALASWLLFYFEPLLFRQSVQNFHWFNVRNPLLSALFLMLVVETLTVARRWSPAVVATATMLCVAEATSGLWLRVEEARRSLPAGEIARVYQSYEQQLTTVPVSLQRGAVVAGDSRFVYMAAILADERPLAGDAVLVSPSVTDNEWMARTALNDYAMGIDDSTLGIALQETYAKFRVEHPELPWVVNRENWTTYVQRRRAVYHMVAADPRHWFEQFGVQYVALRVETGVPVYLHDWQLLAEGPYWRIWRRSATAGLPQPNTRILPRPMRLPRASLCVF